ncbi:ankyrin repeat protein [Dokdonella fugitiva]|uniref:Ankyrin repeat protein n=1 Tax=Dokdonella fugitiva TaxID=328517 RepID=A0A839EYE8_9GAMM|nr:ankyrin repeat domain-containing protein [Dokdonella fugitiva]MBA8888795.1 ankyrin repeat protein [Dokdonella fugitiva]
MKALAFLLLIGSTGAAAAASRDRVIDYLSLCHATAAHDELLVRALLDRGAPVDAPASTDVLASHASEVDSPLQTAAGDGDAKLVRLLLAHKPWVDHRCCTDPPALGIAVAAGHVEVVRLLLEAGADPSITSVYDKPQLETPLDVARRKGYAAIARMIERAAEEKARAKPSSAPSRGGRFP